MRAWSHNLVLCTNGPAQLDTRACQRLSDNGIQLCEERIKRLEGKDGHLEQVSLEHGTALPCKALFFRTDEQQRNNFAAKLGSNFTRKGAVRTDDYERTNVPGLYVAGDASRRVQIVIVAAAEGAEAAFAINTALLKEDLL
ncbi:MAG: FAD-dependent oxidoreductase [Ktedonobacteraceae bacterium]